eukprot:1160135-Pelagomonas_calceolata.AAC.5
MGLLLMPGHASLLSPGHKYGSATILTFCMFFKTRKLGQAALLSPGGEACLCVGGTMADEALVQKWMERRSHPHVIAAGHPDMPLHWLPLALVTLSTAPKASPWFAPTAGPGEDSQKLPLPLCEKTPPLPQPPPTRLLQVVAAQKVLRGLRWMAVWEFALVMKLRIHEPTVLIALMAVLHLDVAASGGGGGGGGGGAPSAVPAAEGAGQWGGKSVTLYLGSPSCTRDAASMVGGGTPGGKGPAACCLSLCQTEQSEMHIHRIDSGCHSNLKKHTCQCMLAWYYMKSQKRGRPGDRVDKRRGEVGDGGPSNSIHLQHR